MAAFDLLTIAQAAAALNLSEPRIHRLLADGDLDGVALPPGRKRQAPGAARVAAASVEQLRAEREELEREHEAAGAKARAQWTRHARSDKPDAVAHPAAGGQLEVEASRAAALELKVRLMRRVPSWMSEEQRVGSWSPVSEEAGQRRGGGLRTVLLVDQALAVGVHHVPVLPVCPGAIAAMAQLGVEHVPDGRGGAAGRVSAAEARK